MIFNTWSFAVFAFATLLLYWLIVPKKAKPAFLVVAGCVFYSVAVPIYLALVVGLGCTTYVASVALIRDAHPGRRKAILAFAVLLIVGILATFKYLGLFSATVNAIASHNVLPFPHLIVPLAISFFTFEFVHVLVDAYLGKVTSIAPIEFATFTMFFPTLVAGPIKRYESFAPQVRSIEMPATRVIALSLYRIAIGLVKKMVIADSMTILTQPMLTPDAAPYGQIEYGVAILAYAAKIYFDFSGYSDIAIGVAGLLGIVIPENFDRPYWSESIGEFWRRWHISLSSWIRDYVFIPLGGSRRPPLQTSLNLLIAMAVAGLWHGAAWTFVAWGLWHGMGLVLHRVWSVVIAPRFARIGVKRHPALRACSTFATFVFVALGWVLFASPTFSDAWITVKRAFLGV